MRSNVKFAQSIAMLSVFEDTDAVIKKDNQRQESNNETCVKNPQSLFWLFDRINLDLKVQIRYMVTKHQIADLLTKGHFTRDEWNNLLCLFQHQPFRLSLLRQDFELQ